MNYTENFDGIKIDVQAVDITIGNDLQQVIRNLLQKLKRYSDFTWADVYFKEETDRPVNAKTVSMRLGIPGPDVFASETGEHWAPLLKSLEEKLRKQIEKRY